jgi:dTMP kinase
MTPPMKPAKNGFFITFEGGEGAGKSTQMSRLVAWMKDNGLKVRSTLEPGGTKIGEKIRELLLDPDHGHLVSRAELLLYEADRAQHAEEILKPSLAQGEIVVSDRFIDSSTVYQGICRKLGVRWVESLSNFATGGLVPHLTLLLDIPVSLGMERVHQHENAWKRQKKFAIDRIDLEKRSFHEQVRKGFLKLASQHARRFAVIDARRSESEVAAEIQKIVLKHLKRRKLWKAR